MKLWKRSKKIAVLALSMTLVFGQASYAATITAGTTQTSSTTANLKQPEVSAQGACLMDAATGQVLYGKNQDQQFYPASITKVMTALLVLERCNLSDTVTFSATATTNLESGAVALGVSEGDQLTVEQSLYGLLLKSANEIGNGLAEHVSGSISAFADLMNEKAASLGCKNTHFANPHGLNNSNHKTTAYDMCLIMRAAVQNETFRKIDTTRTYEFPALKNAAARTITMGHKMMYPSDSRYYEGIIGGKTGYTSLAGNTLVTAAERNGVRLIAVVLKSSGTHYTDTKAMLDYGFENYEALTGRSTSAVTSGDTAASTGNSSAVSGSGSVTVVAGSSSQNAVGPANGSTVTAIEAGNASTGETAGAASETTAAETSQASSPSGNAVLGAPSSSSGQSSELPTTVLTPVQ
jgi:D-alanyl-D-alanine carboxypeptidase